jgi:oligopeptide transport system substrate-binding protein
MQQTRKRTPLAMFIAGLLSISAVYSAQAADVPAGVQLAQQQNIVINNGTEVASLDSA